MRHSTDISSGLASGRCPFRRRCRADTARGISSRSGSLGVDENGLTGSRIVTDRVPALSQLRCRHGAASRRRRGGGSRQGAPGPVPLAHPSAAKAVGPAPAPLKPTGDDASGRARAPASAQAVTRRGTALGSGDPTATNVVSALIVRSGDVPRSWPARRVCRWHSRTAAGGRRRGRPGSRLGRRLRADAGRLEVDSSQARPESARSEATLADAGVGRQEPTPRAAAREATSGTADQRRRWTRG